MYFNDFHQWFHPPQKYTNTIYSTTNTYCYAETDSIPSQKGDKYGNVDDDNHVIRFSLFESIEMIADINFPIADE